MARSINGSWIDGWAVTDMLHPIGTGLFTIALWVRNSDFNVAGTQHIVSSCLTSNSQRGWCLRYVGNTNALNRQIGFNINSSNGSRSHASITPNGSGIMPDADWHFVAVRGFGVATVAVRYTHDTTHVNGNPTGGQSNALITGTNVNNHSQVMRMGRSYIDDAAFVGDMAEFGYWDRPLSDEEINTVRRFGPMKVYRPTHYYKLNGRASSERDELRLADVNINSTVWAEHPNRRV